MGYNTCILPCSKIFPAYEEIYKNQLVKIKVVGDNIEAQFKKAPNFGTAILLKQMYEEGMLAISESVTMSSLIYHGPKIFRPERFNLELLEQMKLNIEFEDYVQPFETVLIELPANYCKRKSVPCPEAGQLINIRSMQVEPEIHQPDCVAVYHDPLQKLIIGSIFLTSTQAYKFIIYPKSGITTIEDAFIQVNKMDFIKGSLTVTDPEKNACNAVFKAVLNYILLIDEVGLLGYTPDNPSYYAKLKKYRDNAQKNNDIDKLRSLNKVIKYHPLIYSINERNVELYKNEKVEIKKDFNQTERIQSPHGRRGHYRIQRYGKNNELKKRIRIPHTFINAHLLFGSKSDLKTNYLY